MLLEFGQSFSRSMESLLTQGPSLQHYLMISALLFAFGLAAAVARRNAIALLMGVELILNAAALNFVAFTHFSPEAVTLDGQIFAVFIIMLAASETAVGLALVLNLYHLLKSVDVTRANVLKG